MTSKNGLLTVFLLVSTLSPAVPIPVASSIKEVGQGVKLPTQISANGQTLCWTGSGIRKKKVVIAKVSVYRLDSYVDCKGVASDGELKASVGLSAKNWALKLTFLRDVDSSKIRSSFKEALEANQVDVSASAPAGQLLEKVQVDLKEGQTLWVVGEKNSPTEKVEIIFPSQSVWTAGSSIASDFAKIWFGVTKESTMETLQSEILSRQYQN